MMRMLTASVKKKEGDLIYLLIDDFDLALIIAAQNGYFTDAVKFYMMLFPADLVQRVYDELQVTLKVVIMTERHLDLPGTLLCAPEVDATLLACNIEAKSKGAFGFSLHEIKSLCTRESLSET